MSSYIKTPAALNAIGSRDNNEDYIYPLTGEADQSTRLFIVCDGMGGPKKGEVAAKLVAESFARDIHSFPPDGELYKGYLDQTLISTEEALSTYMKAYPESIGMGTTMAMVHLHDKRATLAWVGNSRVFHYQFNEKKLSITEASELSSSNDSLQWNPIPQVIHGIETPTQLQFQTVNLSHGDYLFLCTDGMLEQIDQGVLHTLFSTGNPPEKLLEEIKTLTEDSTQDNYSCYLIQMDLEDTPIQITPFQTPPVMEEESKSVPETTNFTETITPPPIEETTSDSVKESEPTVVNDNRDNVDKQKVDMVVWLGVIGFIIIAGIIAITQFFPNKYNSHLATAAQLEGEEQFERAIEFYDSAYYATENTSEKENALALKQKARQALDAMQPAADQLTATGAEAYANSDYPKAIENYEAALQSYAENNIEIPKDFPLEELARSYVMVADIGYSKKEKTPEEESQTLSYYDKASSIYTQLQTDGIALTDESYKDKAFSRGAELSKKLGSQLASNTETSNRGIPANTNRPNTSPEQKSTPSAKAPQNTSTKKPSSPTSTRKVSPSKTAKPSSTPTSRVTATRNVSASTPEGQHLLDGKRLYDEAKKDPNNSTYKYRMAAEHLQMAGDELDGPGAYLLAYMYHRGLGVANDDAQALQYAQKSANMGWAGGYYLYASFLLKRNNKIDSENAVKALKKAAAKKHQPSIDLLKKLGESV